MELTAAYLDKKLEELEYRLDKKIDEKLEQKLDQKLDQKLEEKLTEKLKDVATKDDLKAQTRELMEYTDSVGETILEAVDFGFKQVNRRLDEKQEDGWSKLKKLF